MQFDFYEARFALREALNSYMEATLASGGTPFDPGTLPHAKLSDLVILWEESHPNGRISTDSLSLGVIVVGVPPSDANP